MAGRAGRRDRSDRCGCSEDELRELSEDGAFGEFAI